MSSDFYFHKWKETLLEIDRVLHTDLKYQKLKVHDKKLCEASQRLCGVLGWYMTVYNQALDCLQHNLQVQKTQYIAAIVTAIVDRIHELKSQLRKLEAINYQFLNQGLANFKLTTYDAEMTKIPTKTERPEHVAKTVGEIFKKANEKKEDLIRIAEEEKKKATEEPEQINNWWDEDLDDRNGKTSKSQFKNEYEVEDKLSKETLKKRAFISLIQANEKTRQVTCFIKRQKQKRELWTKELTGTLQPPARLEIREKSVKLIQKILRTYFHLKRQKLIDCKKDELLGIRLCEKPKREAQQKSKQIEERRKIMAKAYEDEWKSLRQKMKEHYLVKFGGGIEDDVRDEIRDWFQKWYKEVQFIYDIPKEKEGGSTLIVSEEVPSPTEWKEDYEAYMEQKKANKDKTQFELKWEKVRAKKDNVSKKKDEQKQRRLQEIQMRKIMKNPNLHPGYNYPDSKQTKFLLDTIKSYHDVWDDLDDGETLDVKEKSNVDIDRQNIYMECKLEIRKKVDEEMRLEQKQLKKALKNEYNKKGEKMPEMIKRETKQEKRKTKIKATVISDVAKKMEELAVKGFLVEYPKIKLKDFIGDYNFAGDVQRCLFLPAYPYNGESRGIWWKRCYGVSHGLHRILLVGAAGSGKTTLVHAMATINDAMLFDLDLEKIRQKTSTPEELLELIKSVATCARATQPAVVYIRHVHRLYYKKPPEDKTLDMGQLKRYLSRKLLRSFHKTDNITIIGSCVDPWLTSSKSMMKQFPTTLLLPVTCYSTTLQILNCWRDSFEHTLPPELNLQSLAQVLQGYSFGFLKRVLNEFMSAERIVKIAAFGVTPEEVYDYVLQFEEDKVDYDKYQKWYYEKTSLGKKEKQHLEDQLVFKELLDKWTKKMEKQKKKKLLVTD